MEDNGSRPEVNFDDKPDRRNLLRNVSTLPVFKKGLFTRCSPSLAGNGILSMDARENSRSSILPSYPSSRDKRIPIYVMMPANAFCIDGTGRPRIRKIKALTVALKALKLACVHGIAVEVWWGIVERFSLLAYDWLGLKLHVALSFHSNVNSSSILDHRDILHILLVMVDGSFLESVNSSAMTRWVTLSWLHARKENLSGKRRNHKRLAVTIVSHLKFLSLERERKVLFLIMGVFASHDKGMDF
ncbi:unnamed protein product [Malus baccata var. baccata]